MVYSAAVSDPAVAGVAVEGDAVTVTAVAKGETTVIVTVTEGGGDSHSVSNGVMKVLGVGAGVAQMSASALDPFGLLAELPWISVLVADPVEDSEQPGSIPSGPHLPVKEFDRKVDGIRHEEVGPSGWQ